MADDVAKAKLQEALQVALELELATIPPYLIALLSIRLPGNREPAELIRSVMIEEMLHIVLVANVLNAIGGSPRFDGHALPRYPLTLNFKGNAFANRRFPINLAAFSQASVETFLKIEEPEEPEAGAALFEVRLDIPSLTIGGFYRKLLSEIDRLSAEDNAALFTGSQDRQIRPDFYWSSGGEIVPVNDAASAHTALGLVISQGEGAWRSVAGAREINFAEQLDMGHYYRFNQIYHARRYQVGDDPAAPPTGAPMAVDYAAVYPIKTNPRSEDYPHGSRLAELNRLFNARYTIMLRQLQEAFGGTPRILYTAILDSMHELTPVAHEMMKIPIEGNEDGATGCPTFEWVENT